MPAVDAAFPLRGRLLPEGFLSVSSPCHERARLCPAPRPILPPHVPRAQPSLVANRTPAGSLLVVGPLHLPSPHERQALVGFRTSSGFPPPQPWRVASRPQSRFYGLRAPSVFSGPARAGLASRASFPGQGLPAPSPCSEAPFRGPRAALRVRCGLSSPSRFLTQLLIARPVLFRGEAPGAGAILIPPCLPSGDGAVLRLLPVAPLPHDKCSPLAVIFQDSTF